MKAQVHDVIANDEHTIVLGTRVVAAPERRERRVNYVNIFHIADGKVTEVWVSRRTMW